jgi:hypothetical protein
MRTPKCSIITFVATAVCVTVCTSVFAEQSAQDGRLELIVHAAEVSGDVYPVSGGIPFPRGELSSVAGIRLLNASGKQLPVQTQMLASWDAGGKQVRWLLLDFQPEGLAAGKNRFTLEYGPEVAVKRDRPAVNAERSSWPPEQIIGSLYMVDQDGKEYASIPDDEETRIELETSGPLRTVVRVHVWLQDRQGKRICRVILRLHYFAGLDRVRILHSLVMDADPEVVKVQGLGLRLSGPENPTGKVLLAGEQNDNQLIESRGEVSLLQESDEHFVVDGSKRREGRRSGTWLSAVGEKNAVGVFLRNGWEEFPKGLKYDGQRIDVQLWPDDGCPMLDLGAIAKPILNPATEEELREGLAAQPSASVSLYRFVTRGQKDWTMNSMLPLIRRAKELERELLPDRFAYYYVIFGKNGQGSMKTHELVLTALPAGVDGDQLNHFAKLVRTPPIVTASPQWNCRSGAFGPQIPYGTGEFTDIDQTMTYDELDDTARFREKLHLYGARNFGDYLNGNPATAGAVYKIYGEDAEVGITRRIGWMNNESHDTTIGAWLQFLRTGDPRIFYRAEAACEHVATVDQQHQFPSADRHLAESFYHTLNHYDGGPASSHTLSSGILLGYYVTGDRGLRETVIANANYYVEQQQQDGTGWYAGNSPSRSNIAPMTCILNAYTATWDKKYLNSLNRFLVVWAGVYDVQKHYLGGTLPYPGAEFLRLVDHPIFEDAYCKIMDDLRTKKSIDGQSPYYMPGLIYMWQKTGDPTYLAYCRLVFQWYRNSLETRGYADSVRRLVNGLPEFKYGMVSGYLAAGLAGLEEGRRKGVDFKAALKKLSAARSGELYYSIYGTLEGVPGQWVPSDF